MRGIRLCAVGAASMIAFAGCGSSGAPKHAGTRPGSRAGGEASKSPAQILSDAMVALRDARGYVMEGQVTQRGELQRLRVLARPNSIELSISSGPAAVQEIVLPGGDYIHGNTAFWSAHLGARGVVLANRWIEVPPASVQALTAAVGHFAPATLSRCLDEGHGTLSIGGETSVSGRPAVVIRDAGNAPGDGPGTLAVATTGPPYPLRITSTGPQHPGGRIDVCNDGKGGDSVGSLVLSHFGNVPPIAPPSHPIRPAQPGQAGTV